MFSQTGMTQAQKVGESPSPGYVGSIKPKSRRVQLLASVTRCRVSKPWETAGGGGGGGGAYRLDILAVRQPEVLLGGDVAQHGRPTTS